MGKRLHKNHGAGLVGYGLVVGLIAVVALGAVTSVGTQVDGLFGEVSGELEGVSGASSGSSGSSSGPNPSPSASPVPVEVIGALTPSDPGIFADGASAVSCNEYLVPSTPDQYAAATGGSGVYTIDPDGNNSGNSPFNVYCDMDPATGGWTLVGRINSADQDNLDEPNNWFTSGTNQSQLLSASDTRNGGMSAHGASLFTPIITDNASLSRFVARAESNLSVSGTFYKTVTSANFTNWFNAAEGVATPTCTNVDMTANCSTSAFIVTTGSDHGVYWLNGMNLASLGLGGAGVLHTRQNGANADHFSALCSYTINSSSWPDNYQTHWGNVLEIWLR
ncbi:MAG: hypothetical protein Alpg2KO_16180 [Alphaproteobacteria bacterium]